MKLGQIHMKIRDLHAAEIDEAREFLCAQGWAHRIASPGEFRRLIENTQRTAVAIVDGQIVGFARGVTDGLSNGYLSMVAVAPEFRRGGIGRALVEHITGPDRNITWLLRAGREDAVAFFSELGFVTSSVAMERVRSEARPNNGVQVTRETRAPDA